MFLQVRMLIMKIKEWQKFHGFTDETSAHIDKVKKLFCGTITEVRTAEEYKKMNEDITKSNKMKIDMLWIK